MGANREEGDRLVGDREIAERLSMSPSTVRQQRRRRKHGMSHFLTIDSVKVGEKSVRYWAKEVDAFFASLKAANDNDAADEGGEA